MSNKPPPRGGYIDPNYPPPNGPQDATIIIYGYIPSFALCILACILFFLSLCVHLFLLFRHRLWSFSPLALGCTLEVIGYIFRSFSAKRDPYNIIYFVVQYFMIVTAPVFISASIYVCLSKLIRWAQVVGLLHPSSILSNTNPNNSSASLHVLLRLTNRLLSPRLILWTFITIDILSTITQIAGAALIGSYESNRKDPKKPNDILLAGLAIQTFSFTIYLMLLTLFRYAISKHSSSSSPSSPALALAPESQSKSKDPFILALLLSSLLIYLRTIFRLAETGEGVYGYLSTHEAYFGALEFAPVVLAVGILGGWHPGIWIGRAQGFDSRGGRNRGQDRRIGDEGGEALELDHGNGADAGARGEGVQERQRQRRGLQLKWMGISKGNSRSEIAVQTKKRNEAIANPTASGEHKNEAGEVRRQEKPTGARDIIDP